MKKVYNAEQFITVIITNYVDRTMLQKHISILNRLHSHYTSLVSKLLGPDFSPVPVDSSNSKPEFGKEGIFDFQFVNHTACDGGISERSHDYGKTPFYVLSFIVKDGNEKAMEESSILFYHCELIRRGIASLFLAFTGNSTSAKINQKDDKDDGLSNSFCKFSTIFKFQVTEYLIISLRKHFPESIKESPRILVSPTLQNNKPRPRGDSQLSTDENISSASLLDITRKKSLFSNKDSLMLLKDESELMYPLYDSNGVVIESEVVNPKSSRSSKRPREKDQKVQFFLEELKEEEFNSERESLSKELSFLKTFTEEL